MSHPPRVTIGAKLQALVVAYVNESVPCRGQQGLRTQMRAVERRARRDGVSIGLLVIESGGRLTTEGRGRRLGDVIAAARLDPADRVLYVADTTVLAE